MQIIDQKSKENIFKEATRDGIMSNKKFWSTAKPFLTLKTVSQRFDLKFSKMICEFYQ